MKNSSIEKQNAYLKSQQIGYEQGDDGISFSELKKELIKEKIEFREDILKDWYYRTFEHPGKTHYLKNPINQNAGNDQIAYQLSPESFIEHADYLEFKETRQNTHKTLKLFNRLMWVLIIVTILNAVFSVLVIFRN